ncbi:MAG: hypothetical protein KIT73_19715 [Burkholderiales bacterium]|nr:hypothetical protein [Burkholderiales bacterium]
MKTVTVYRFEERAHLTNEWKPTSLLATRAYIEHATHKHLRIVEGSEQQVAASLVDRRGLYIAPAPRN